MLKVMVFLLKLRSLCTFSGTLISSRDASMLNTRKVASMCSVRYCLCFSRSYCFRSQFMGTYSSLLNLKYDEKKFKSDLFIDIICSL